MTKARLAEFPGPHLTGRSFRGVDLVGHLLDTAASHPGPLVVHADEAMFAPHMGNIACVGARGQQAVRSVLTNPRDYRTIAPVVEGVPDDIAVLSDSVFSAFAADHALQRTTVRRLLDADRVDDDAVAFDVRAAIAPWTEGTLDLVTACRDLAYEIWPRILFGDGQPARRVGAAVRGVVDARRARRVALRPAEARRATHATVHASGALIEALTHWFNEERANGVLTGFRPIGVDEPSDATRKATMAQVTALAAASIEPFAASLSWLVLVLTQRPDLQDAISAEVGAADPLRRSVAPVPGSTLDHVLLETQRLLPSSALVTRVTARPVELAGCRLPARCEVVVSSLLEQRSAQHFEMAATFRPERWASSTVSPFEYFPFGAGIRACLGASIARRVLAATISTVLTEATLRLPFDNEVGWQLPDALTPSRSVRFVADDGGRPGLALGPIRRLIDFDGPAA